MITNTETSERLKRPVPTLIFTDLDGALLDHETYSFEKAESALSLARETKTPVIPVTSKTYDEVAMLQKELLLPPAPVIVEGGGASYIPEGIFSVDQIKAATQGLRVFSENGFVVVEYAKPVTDTIQLVQQAAEVAGIVIRLNSDLTPEQFAEETGLTLEKAHAALNRKYQIGFKAADHDKNQAATFQQYIAEAGATLSAGGRYSAVTWGGSKRQAVRDIAALYAGTYGIPTTIGLGDAPADLEFITECDHGYLVRNPKKPIEGAIVPKGIIITESTGPDAWNTIVMSALQQ